LSFLFEEKPLEKQTAICRLLKDYTSNTPITNFLDIGIRPVMFKNLGQLRIDIFVADSLHLKYTGNQLVTGDFKPILIIQLQGENRESATEYLYHSD